MGRKIAMAIAVFIALASGVAYSFFFFLMGWIVGDDLRLGIGVVLGLVAAALVLPSILSGMVRPAQPWLFPSLFSACTILVGLATIGEPITAAVWIATGVVTFLLGLVGSLFTLARNHASSP